MERLRPMKDRAMKTFKHLSFGLVVIALTLVFFSGCQTSSTAGSSSSGSATANANSGQLVIQRVANLGNLDIVDVMVDGKRVGVIPRGQTYNGAVSAGPHVISAKIASSNAASPAATKRITVQKGQTYAFTASWKDCNLSLD
jgi:hypothetical protein